MSPSPEQNILTVLVNRAIDNFNQNERYLIENDLSERCICSKFSMYLDQVIRSSEFSDYTVDVEYNRGYQANDYLAKVLFGHKILLDIVVHKRGYNETSGYQNLICIEMKKAYKHPDLSSDEARLRAMTDNAYGFGYQAGFMITAYANKKTGQYGLEIHKEFYNQGI